MATNLYVALGVDAQASPEKIQSAYRQAADDFEHGATPPEAQSLQQMQEAYSTLIHPRRRRAYDERVEPLRSTTPESRTAILEDPARAALDVLLGDPTASVHPSFAELFDRFWSNFELLTRPKAERLESLTVELPLSVEEAATGGRARIRIPARAQCPTCSGHGAVGGYECWRCQGHGTITADYPVDVLYPGGIFNEYVVQLPLDQFGIANFYLTVRFRVTEQ